MSAQETQSSKQWTWVDSYYEALEFFYLEPQHMRPKTEASAEVESLRALAKKTTKLQTVLKKFRAMEVPFNHNLRQFFLLAPDSLRNRFFGHLFEPSFHGSFAMQGREVDRDFHLDNCMQPDFLFVSATDVVSIEMKIASKSSVDQVLKYALLGVAVELQQGEKEHSLILLGPGEFPALFRNRFETPEKLCNALAIQDLAAFLKNKPKLFRGEGERLLRIVKQIRVQFLSYSDLGEFLEDEIPVKEDPSPGAEVYRKLIDGLLQEIQLRELR